MVDDVKTRVVFIFILIALGVIVLALVSPSLQPIPSRDSGVYLYIGNGILSGQVPYRDFWDHKGPLIYYINALGLSLIRESYWGVWLVEYVFLIVAVIISFSLMRHILDPISAFVGTAIWVLGLNSTIDGGNRVEEYALAFYFLQVFLYFHKGNRPTILWRFVLIGASATLCILLRPNLISPLLCITLLTLWDFFVSQSQEKFKYFWRLVSLAAGAALTFVGVLAYFASQSAFRDFYYDVFAYNFLYVTTGEEHWNAFLSAIRLLGWVAYIGFAAWIILWFLILRSRMSMENRRLLLFLLLAFPLEIVFSLISGYKYTHYFIPWLPAIGLLAGVIIHQAQISFQSLWKGVLVRRSWILLYGLLVVACVIFLKSNFHALAQMLIDPFRFGKLFPVEYDRSREWIDAKQLLDIVPNDAYVFFWGNEVKYNFVMDFPAPSRYSYLYPFAMPRYITDDMAREFLTGIKQNQPVIVDIQPSALPSIESLNKWRQYPGMIAVVRYIQKNYQISTRFDVMNVVTVDNRQLELEREWIVWMHKE